MANIKITLSGSEWDDDDGSIIQISINDADIKALKWKFYSVPEWVENVVTATINSCIKRIVAEEIPKMMDDPEITVIPKNRHELVRIAKIKSAKERQEEFEKVMVTNSMSEKTKE